MLARPRPVNKPKAPTPKRRNSTANKFVGAGYLERTSGAVLEVGAMPWTYFVSGRKLLISEAARDVEGGSEAVSR
jgi:hypothetical protein